MAHSRARVLYHSCPSPWRSLIVQVYVQVFAMVLRFISSSFPSVLSSVLLFLVCSSHPPRRMYLKFVEPIYLECLRERMMSDIKFEAVAR